MTLAQDPAVSALTLAACFAALAIVSCSTDGPTPCPTNDIGKACGDGLCVAATCVDNFPDGSTQSYSCAACAQPMDDCLKAEAGTPCGPGDVCGPLTRGYDWVVGTQPVSVSYTDTECEKVQPVVVASPLPAPSAECDLATGGNTSPRRGLVFVVGIALTLYVRRRSTRGRVAS
jgi:hypothetical protein